MSKTLSFLARAGFGPGSGHLLGALAYGMSGYDGVGFAGRIAKKCGYNLARGPCCVIGLCFLSTWRDEPGPGKSAIGASAAADTAAEAPMEDAEDVK
jgi:hypothetical protein